MKIMACSSATVKLNTPYTSAVKNTGINKRAVKKSFQEPDYGKSLKQLSYIVSMSILGISGIILGTKGKVLKAKI